MSRDSLPTGLLIGIGVALAIAAGRSNDDPPQNPPTVATVDITTLREYVEAGSDPIDPDISSKLEAIVT